MVTTEELVDAYWLLSVCCIRISLNGKKWKPEACCYLGPNRQGAEQENIPVQHRPVKSSYIASSPILRDHVFFPEGGRFKQTCFMPRGGDIYARVGMSCSYPWFHITVVVWNHKFLRKLQTKMHGVIPCSYLISHYGKSGIVNGNFQPSYNNISWWQTGEHAHAHCCDE